MTAPPPFAAVLGVRQEADGEGAPVLVMPFGEAVTGRPGFLHGGALAGLLEMAAIAGVQHALAEDGGGRVKPINVTVDYRRGGREKETRAVGVVTRLGTRVANVDAVAWQDDRNEPIATARFNFLVARE